MEKTEITVSFDAKKLEAMEAYLKLEKTSLKKRLEETVEGLYEQIVPEAVREFIDMMAPQPRPKRPAPPPKPPSREGGPDLKKEEEEHEQP